MGNSFSNGNLFSPKTVRGLLDGDGPVIGVNKLNFSGSNVTGSDSFSFSNPSDPLSSTQQINLDWSKFENHTFFNSAESKVNVAFDTIINYFPFDGTYNDIDTFMAQLSGYEKYVYDSFPKNRGCVIFSGTQPGEDPSSGFSAQLGNIIPVDDAAGVFFPSISKDKTAKNVLNSGDASISYQFWIKCPEESNENQVILQKLNKDDNQGISLVLSQSSSTLANFNFIVSSGSNVMSASYQFPKNEFIHLCAYFEREPNKLSNLQIFNSGTLVATSDKKAAFGKINYSQDKLFIGSGSAHDLGSLDSNSFDPIATFSGSLDDLRCYHGKRSAKLIRFDYNKSVFSTENLKLYYKFNEPAGDYSNNNIVLDSSGNSLHSYIMNYTNASRCTDSNEILLERSDLNPVLFPGYPDLISLNESLLSIAAEYDSNNPNLITNLIPPHYIEEATDFEGYQNDFANTGDPYSYTQNLPGKGKIGQPQIISSLLFTWAKFFDEIKVFIDHFGNLLTIDYNKDSTISDYMLTFLSEYYGFNLPNLFSNANFEQYLIGENLDIDSSISANSLFTVQTEIWRRILTNLNYIIQSKGTINAVKSVMRSAGINPDTMFRFREFGGSRTISVSDARRNKSETASMLHITSSNSSIISPFLSSSRNEPGYPYPQAWPSTMRSDGLFTSGSWTFEGIYQFSFSETSILPLTQSLVRFYSTGSTGVASSGDGALLTNVVAYGTGSNNITGSIKVFARPNSEDSAPTMNLILTGVNIFDKEKWHISFGRNFGTKEIPLNTPEYFLRATKTNNGTIVEHHVTSSNFSLGSKQYDVFSNANDSFNASGSYFEIGPGDLGASLDTSGNKFLNSSAIVTENNARITKLRAKIAAIRFWSSALSEKETKEHSRNFKSVGVSDPLKNYNFVTNASGSWERLRINASIDQQITESNISGEISVFDFSQNNLFLNGSSFETSKRVIFPELFHYSILDPKFDERSSENKIKIMGFENDLNIEEFNSLKSPVRSPTPGQPLTSDSRFSIEVSAVDALNEDIINILDGLDWLDAAIGNPELQFAESYPSLSALREVYFNRLTDKVNFDQLFLFYKWFDDSLSIIIERLIPKSTKYLGINFVIESHFLERPKFRNMNNSIYLSPSDRRYINNELLIAVLSGKLKRF
jgi:hypothetical protein